MDIAEKINRLKAGDPVAASELIEMQRNGMALRLYPNGRRGADDEGMTPLLIRRTPELTLHVQVGQPCAIVVHRKQLGPVMMFLFDSIALMAANRNAYDESKLSEKFGFSTSVTADETVFITLNPPGNLDYYLGFEQCIAIIAAWLAFIDQHEWTIEECGLSHDDYVNLSATADDR